MQEDAWLSNRLKKCHLHETVDDFFPLIKMKGSKNAAQPEPSIEEKIMTTRKARRFTLALLLPLLLAVGCDSTEGTLMSAESPEAPSGAFTIRFAQDVVSPTTSKGSFKAFGFIDDNGGATETLSSAEPLYKLTSLTGTKVLDGEKGTITIEYYLSLYATDHNTVMANGGFRIVSGSGDYAGMQGDGEINLEVERNTPPAALTQVIEGRAQYMQ